MLNPALTGLKPECVTRAFRDELGWHVRAEMLELARGAASADVLAEYEVLMGDEGEVLNLERRHTRLRADSVHEEGT